jgi:hypothetical protein
MRDLKTIIRISSLLWLLTPLTALSYTDAEIDQMLGELRKENQTLKEEIRQLKETTDDQSLQQTTVKPTANNQQDTKPTAHSVMRTLENEQDKFQINGFLSAGVAEASRDVSDQNVSFSDSASFDTDSIVGLQTTFHLNDTTDVTAQLVARGSDNWDLEADWAFIRYSPTDELSLRAGRLRLPLYLFSESLEVGFSYPWVRPPSEVYAIPIDNYNGVDSIYNLNAGNWVHSVQLFVGNENDDTFETQVFYGGNLSSNLDAWTIRLSAYTFDLKFKGSTISDEVDAILAGVKNGGDYYTLASMYDDGSWLLITELSMFKADKPELFRDTNAGYITLGKHFGKFLPHFTFAHSETTDEPDFTPFPIFEPGTPPAFIGLVTEDPANCTGDSYTLGLRYDLSPNASAKLEWSHYTNLDDTGGIWSSLRYDLPDGAKNIDDIDIVSIVIDAVF